ncbi:hypothetical protein [Vibrio sp. Vb339]|uniref:hypothetical protein n=1 Tax=Vibrio sp. Vb339 TaxID=1192013 RepID=UPI001551899F|nr:hypothetical protein [Vibrio sp. Vb339]
MMLGIAAEGKTDQHTIENILVGYFNSKGYKLSTDEVYQAQPSGDATDLDNVNGYGSWTNLLDYLQNEKIKEDVAAYDFLILQVDTDVCDEKTFNVPITEGGVDKPVSDLVDDVIERLILEMNSSSPDFYENNKDKLIFAISVHSIECWIYKHFESNTKKSGVAKTKSCEAALRTVINQNHRKMVRYLSKTKNNYLELTKDFRKHRSLEGVLRKDISFKIFYENLDVIPIPQVEEDNDW